MIDAPNANIEFGTVLVAVAKQHCTTNYTFARHFGVVTLSSCLFALHSDFVPALRNQFTPSALRRSMVDSFDGTLRNCDKVANFEKSNNYEVQNVLKQLSVSELSLELVIFALLDTRLACVPFFADWAAQCDSKICFWMFVSESMSCHCPRAMSQN